ncbi:hypothetical protein V5O48_013861 [Marasmius crinis-equi]|uniref:PPPDE domain-containing protein n=1 Tax=Marasmius crinis-equi TaxID=585013 RepID=A0ABR3EYX1_9AGAR
MAATTGTQTKPPNYAVSHCMNQPQPCLFTPQTFEKLVQDVDLKCTVRAIALCKRTDGFQHETLIPIITLPDEPTEALMFVERAGCWRDWTLLNSSAESLSTVKADPTQQEQHNATKARDIITLFPKSSLFWRYDTTKGSNLPFDQLPLIVKDSSTSYPSPDLDALVKNEADQSRESFTRTKGDGKAKHYKGGGPRRLFKRRREPDPVDTSLDEPPANWKADHAFIYAITFPQGENCEPPSVLDLAIVIKLVSEHRPNYSLVNHNCYFFAAAVCKVMEQKFGGRKVRNAQFRYSDPPPTCPDVQASSSTDTHPQAGVYDSRWLQKAGIKPIQILREDGQYFKEMIKELVTNFDEECKVHRVTRHEQTEGKLQEARVELAETRAELTGILQEREDELTQTRARLTEMEERMREMERRLQQFEQPSSTLPGH